MRANKELLGPGIPYHHLGAIEYAFELTSCALDHPHKTQETRNMRACISIALKVENKIKLETK